MSKAFSFEEDLFEFDPEFEQEETHANAATQEKRLMAYEIVGKSPAAIGGHNVPGKAPAACPPFKFACDMNCPFTLLECQTRRKYLCDRILGAINLAQKAASELETKPLSNNTVNKFRRIFGQSPFDRWDLPWTPRRTMLAGNIVASRFRTVEKELRTRDTLYRCLCNGSGSSPGREEPSHPTETIVRDLNAWAVLCKNEVRLCPPFWKQNPKGAEGTILHEMFHLCFGLTCAWFQHDRIERKRNNAYCYEVFALGSATEPITITMCDSSRI